MKLVLLSVILCGQSEVSVLKSTNIKVSISYY